MLDKKLHDLARIEKVLESCKNVLAGRHDPRVADSEKKALLIKEIEELQVLASGLFTQRLENVEEGSLD